MAQESMVVALMHFQNETYYLKHKEEVDRNTAKLRASRKEVQRLVPAPLPASMTIARHISDREINDIATEAGVSFMDVAHHLALFDAPEGKR